jgi:hypothetical protein
MLGGLFRQIIRRRNCSDFKSSGMKTVKKSKTESQGIKGLLLELQKAKKVTVYVIPVYGIREILSIIKTIHRYCTHTCVYNICTHYLYISDDDVEQIL